MMLIKRGDIIMSFATHNFYLEYQEFCKSHEQISFADFIAMKNYLLWSDKENRPVLDVGLYTLQSKGAEMKIDIQTLEY